ncbi:MAG: hypothetical protein ABEN55_01660, partial [Bradymonadaceae bacterium]
QTENGLGGARTRVESARRAAADRATAFGVAQTTVRRASQTQLKWKFENNRLRRRVFEPDAELESARSMEMEREAARHGRAALDAAPTAAGRGRQKNRRESPRQIRSRTET